MRVGVHCDLETCNDTKLWALDFLECDAHEILAASKAGLAKLKKTLSTRGQGLTLLANHDTSLDDKTMSLMQKLTGELGAEAFVLQTTTTPPVEWTTRWKSIDGAPPLFVDPGKEQRTTDGVASALDPFHCEDPALSVYWRVHGWPPKWSLKDLSKLTLLYYPDWVVLAHPDRMEEAADLKGRLI